MPLSHWAVRAAAVAALPPADEGRLAGNDAAPPPGARGEP